MARSEVINIAVSATDARSVSDVTAKIVNEARAFASKYDVADQFDPRKLEEDLIIFLVKRRVVGLEEIRITVLEDGGFSVGNVISGPRRADLLVRLHYKEGLVRRL